MKENKLSAKANRKYWSIFRYCSWKSFVKRIFSYPYWSASFVFYQLILCSGKFNLEHREGKKKNQQKPKPHMHINKIGTMKYSGPAKTQLGWESCVPTSPTAQEGSGQHRHPRTAGSPPAGGGWVYAGFRARDQNFCTWLHKASDQMNPSSLIRLKISQLHWLRRWENPAEITL